jgi:hypothetical protein
MRSKLIQKEIQNVPSKETSNVMELFQREGAQKVSIEKQENGKYTIKAVFEEKVLAEKKFAAL